MAHRAAASCDRLVTPPGTTAKCNIIHTSLRGGTHTESLQNNVDDSLGRQNVAADHRGVVTGIQDWAFRDDDLDRGETTLKTNKNISRLDGSICVAHICVLELPEVYFRFYGKEGEVR